MKRCAAAILAACVAACSRGSCGKSAATDHDSGVSAAPARAVASLAPLASAPTTDEQTIAPTHARARDPRDSAVPANLDAMLIEGFGAYALAAGEIPAAPRPSLDRAKLVARVAQLSDTHVVDDESPARSGIYDGEPPLSGAFRPQEGGSCQMLAAAVRTLNALHEQSRIDAVLLSGDAIDSAQDNELSWLLAILDGDASIACDSGTRDDPVPGPGNDGKDPFASPGLRVPWYFATGNHDVLVQGSFAVTPITNGRAVGDRAAGGTRDYRRAGAPIVTSSVPADAARAQLTRARLFARLGVHVGDRARTALRSDYAIDIGDRVRVLAVDTANEEGGAEGIVRSSTLDDFLAPELARASADHRAVIVVSHHAADAIAARSDDAVTGEAWAHALAAPPVIASLVGHGHRNRVRRLGPQPMPIEIMTGALIDFPSPIRVIEIWETPNGALTLRSTLADYVTVGDPVAERARVLSIVDFVSERSSGGAGAASDRNFFSPLSPL